MPNESTTIENNAPPEPPRSWWRFSLGAMFVVVTLFAIGLGWYENAVGRVSRVASTIRESGGWVDVASWNEIQEGTDFPTPSKGWFPPEFYAPIKGVGTSAKIWSDSEMALLAHLPELEILCIRYSEVSEAGFARLAKLKQLRYLQLGNARINDAGLAHLAGLDKLEHLQVNGANITDDGLRHLAGLKNLKTLNLGFEGGYGDAGLVHLLQLDNLYSLGLSGSKVTDAGLIHLQKLKNLSTLDLGFTKVTDGGLAHLCPPHFPSVQDVSLVGTRVSRDGLSQFRSDRSTMKTYPITVNGNQGVFVPSNMSPLPFE